MKFDLNVNRRRSDRGCVGNRGAVAGELACSRKTVRRRVGQHTKESGGVEETGADGCSKLCFRSDGG